MFFNHHKIIDILILKLIYKIILDSTNLKRIKENCQKQQQIPFQEKFCNDSMDLNLFQFYLFDFKEY